MLGKSNHAPRINIGPPNFRCQILVPLPICIQLPRHSSEEMMKNAWCARVPWLPNFGTKTSYHAERKMLQPKCRVDIKSCGGMTCCFSVLSSSTKVFLLIGRALADKKHRIQKITIKKLISSILNSQLKIYQEARTSNLSEPCLIHTVTCQIFKSTLIMLSRNSKNESGMTCRQSCLITHL